MEEKLKAKGTAEKPPIDPKAYKEDDYLDQERKAGIVLLNQNNEQRKWLAQWAATVCSFWLLFVLGILYANHWRFKLSDTVLVTLLTTTTVNVLGLIVIVMTDLFSKKGKEKGAS